MRLFDGRARFARLLQSVGLRFSAIFECPDHHVDRAFVRDLVLSLKPPKYLARGGGGGDTGRRRHVLALAQGFVSKPLDNPLLRFACRLGALGLCRHDRRLDLRRPPSRFCCRDCACTGATDALRRTRGAVRGKMGRTIATIRRRLSSAVDEVSVAPNSSSDTTAGDRGLKARDQR